MIFRTSYKKLLKQRDNEQILKKANNMEVSVEEAHNKAKV